MGEGRLLAGSPSNFRRSLCAATGIVIDRKMATADALAQKNMRIVEDAANSRQDRREQSLEIKFDRDNKK